MAWTQQDIDDLDRAIALGVREVTFADGSSTKFRSQRDMLSLREKMERTVNGGSGTTRAFTVSMRSGY